MLFPTDLPTQTPRIFGRKAAPHVPWPHRAARVRRLGSRPRRQQTVGRSDRRSRCASVRHAGTSAGMDRQTSCGANWFELALPAWLPAQCNGETSTSCKMRLPINRLLWIHHARTVPCGCSLGRRELRALQPLVRWHHEHPRARKLCVVVERSQCVGGDVGGDEDCQTRDVWRAIWGAGATATHPQLRWSDQPRCERHSGHGPSSSLQRAGRAAVPAAQAAASAGSVRPAGGCVGPWPIASRIGRYY